MIEITRELKNKIDENICKCIDWFVENADDNESIYVKYNPDNSKRGYKDEIRVSPGGLQTESGNLWGYNTVWTPIDEMPTGDKLEILQQWEDIKDRFLSIKERKRLENNATLDLINNFEV